MSIPDGEVEEEVSRIIKAVAYGHVRAVATYIWLQVDHPSGGSGFPVKGEVSPSGKPR
jgi:hypothetical protein